MKIPSNLKIFVASAIALTGGSNAAIIQFDYNIEDFGDVGTPTTVVSEVFSLDGVASINSVSIDLSHSYAGDILFTLTAPDGDLYNLLTGAGGPADFGDGTEFLTGLETYTFVEVGDPIVFPVAPGTFGAPAWGDGSPAGDWTLTLTDRFDGDDGAVGAIVIDYTAIPEPSTSLLGGLAALALLRRRRR